MNQMVAGTARDPVKVLVVMGQSAGGIGRHVAQIVGELDGKEGLRIDLAAPATVTVELPKQVHEITMPRSLSAGHLKTVLQLRRLVRAGEYQIVHAHGLRAGLDAAICGRATRTPVVVTLHNLADRGISSRGRTLVSRGAERLLLRLATWVFCVSREMRERLVEGSTRGAERIELLPIGVVEPHTHRTRAQVRTELGIENGQPLVVTVARLERQKALDVMIEAIVQVPGATLTIVGDGPLRSDLEAKAEAESVTERVRFLGWRNAVGDYLRAADVFALSSVWEARALAAQEAILAGVPVVSTDVGGMNELIQDGWSGRLVARGSAPELAAALRDVLTDPDGAKQMAERARIELTRNYSTEQMLARVTSTYRRLAGA